MSLFKSKLQTYSTEEIAQQVTNLERLNKLRDMCLQKTVLQPNGAHWKQEGMRYERNIETAQKLLDHMAETNTQAGTV